MWPNPHFPADLVTFTEEILCGFAENFIFCAVKLSDISWPMDYAIKIVSRNTKRQLSDLIIKSVNNIVQSIKLPLEKDWSEKVYIIKEKFPVRGIDP